MKNVLVIFAVLGLASPAFAKAGMMKKRSGSDSITVKNNTNKNFERVSVKVVFQGRSDRGYHRTHEGYIEIADVKAGAAAKANLLDARVDRCHHRYEGRHHTCTMKTVLDQHFGNNKGNVDMIYVRFISAGKLSHGMNETRTRGNFARPVTNPHGTEDRSFMIEGNSIKAAENKKIMRRHTYLHHKSHETKMKSN